MHEFSIAENMLDIVLQYARQNGATRVTDLHVIIGDLASTEALGFHWQTVSRGTLAEGAQLHFDLIPTHLYCCDCNQLYDYKPDSHAPHTHDYECAVCHSKNVEVAGGETFRLDSIEIERDALPT